MRTCDRLYCCQVKQQITLIVFPKELLLNCRCFCPKIWTPAGDLHHTIRLPAAHHLGTSITPYGTGITPSGDLHLHHTIQEPASRHPGPSITSFGAQHRINVRSRRCHTTPSGDLYQNICVYHLCMALVHDFFLL